MHSAPRGFTLVELLVVIIVLAILTALLLPAINGAVRTAREAAVQAEINQLAQALESFKSKYGDYPPSRLYVAEDGDYSAATLSDAASPSLGPGDIHLNRLAQRSVATLRKFFPKAQFNTSGAQVFRSGSTVWYDFNGNNRLDTHYILQGHECLVLFLGGVPIPDTTDPSRFGLSGFSKDPTNPFLNPAWSNGQSRQSPFFEFNAGRLQLDPTNTSLNGTTNPGVPGYYDSLGNAPPSGPGGPINFYVYFNSYGGAYDPNDVNFPSETDGNGNTHIGLLFGLGGISSYAPNPYTSSLTTQATGLVTYQKPQSFQIFSSGMDGLYGVGGQYVDSSVATGADKLPFDSSKLSSNPVTFFGVPPTVTAESDSTQGGDPAVRKAERDNLTNFKSGRLQ